MSSPFIGGKIRGLGWKICRGTNGKRICGRGDRPQFFSEFPLCTTLWLKSWRWCWRVDNLVLVHHWVQEIQIQSIPSRWLCLKTSSTVWENARLGCVPDMQFSLFAVNIFAWRSRKLCNTLLLVWSSLKTCLKCYNPDIVGLNKAFPHLLHTQQNWELRKFSQMTWMKNSSLRSIGKDVW